MMPATPEAEAELDRLESILDGTLFHDPPIDPWHGVLRDTAGNVVKPDDAAGDGRIYNVGPGQYNPAIRANGQDWPATALTMIGTRRLRNVREVLLDVEKRGIEGDFMECGVWRGGASLYALATIYAYQMKRRVILADSFQGLPQEGEDIHHTFTALAVSQEEVQGHFDAWIFGREHEQRLDQPPRALPPVLYVKGWFKDTLPGLDVKLAVLRADGDLYSSTMDILNGCYSKVINGGVIIIDDYHAVPGCKKAVTEFHLLHNITDRLVEIDGVGVYWTKGTAQ